MTTIDPRVLEMDKQVESLIKHKEKLVAELDTKRSKIGKTQWKSVCTSKQLSINIQVAKLPQLIDFVSHVLLIARNHEESMDFLELTPKQREKNDAMFENCPVEHWLEDAKHRVKIIEIRELEEKINRVNKMLEDVKSEVQKRQDAIKGIQEFLAE